MSHEHPVIDSDLHFIINPSTREITNSSEKIKLMQYDHQSECFTFEIPRYIEGHDMLLCDLVEIHYTNVGSSDKSNGVYLVDDAQLKTDDESTITFSWLISNNATKYAGSLNFGVRFACTNGANVEYAWNTAIYSGISIGSAIDNTGSLEEVKPDIIASVKEEMSKLNTSLQTINERISGILNDPNSLTIELAQSESNYEIALASDTGYGDISLSDSSGNADYSQLMQKIKNRWESGGAIKIYINGAEFDARPYSVTDNSITLAALSLQYELDGNGRLAISNLSNLYIILSSIDATITFVEY